ERLEVGDHGGRVLDRAAVDPDDGRLRGIAGLAPVQAHAVRERDLRRGRQRIELAALTGWSPRRIVDADDAAERVILSRLRRAAQRRASLRDSRRRALRYSRPISTLT